MKRYLMFCGSTYYPSGGWGDFLGSFDSIEEGKTALLATRKTSREADWWHVIDGTNGEEVASD